MQLILDSEASIDINEKMSTLEESLDKTLNDGVETLKTAVISNGNKENIQRQENIIKHSEEEHNGVDKDLNDEVDASLTVHDKKLENNENVQIGDDKDIFTDVKINGFVEEEKKDLEDFNLDTKIDNATIDEKAANLESCETEKDAEDSKLFNIDSEEINDSKNIDNIPETETNKVKEILDCSFEESKNDAIEADSVNVPNASDKVIDTPMEVECELEDIEKNSKETLSSETESPVIDSLGSEKDKNVTVDSKLSETESIETAMELDVSKPELSTKKSITPGDEEMDFEDEVTEDTHTIDEILEHITSDNEETGLENKLHVDAVLENTTLNEKTTSIEKEALLLQSTSGDVDLKNTPIEGNISSTEKESTLEDTKTDSENITSTEKEDALEDGKQAFVEKGNLENNVLTAEKEVASEDGLQTAVQKETENNVISTEKESTLKDTTTSSEKEALENVTATKEDVISEKPSIVDDAVIEKSLSNDEEVVSKESTSGEVLNAKPSDIALENMVTDTEKALTDEEVLEENTSIDEENKVIADDKEIEIVASEPVTPSEATIAPQEKPEPQKKPYSKLSNTLDILSDDEDDSPPMISKKDESSNVKSKEEEEAKTIEKQCINIEDDDDIMLIDEDTSTKECTDEDSSQKKDQLPEKEDLEKITETVESSKPAEDDICDIEKEIASPVKEISCADSETGEEVKPKEDKMDKAEVNKPLLPENFLKTYKKNLADMTRDDLEEFCILKIVESIVDRSNLSDIKTKMKEMAQNIEEYKKKAMMLTKQNRDLQVVLKSVQEEQKKFADNPTVIKPLKITRSVGMQVLMTEKPGMRKKPVGPVGSNVPNNPNNRNIRTPNQSPKPQKPPVANQPIPVPRLVPANNTVGKISVVPSTQNPSFTTQAKTPTPSQNGVRNSPPVQKVAEKRPISRIQSVTVDLTDDEPPAKITPRSSPAPPVRLVSPQNLLPPRQAFGQSMNTNSPRKVYIPISGPQGQNIRPGQAIMIKSVPTPGPRPRVPPPHMARMPQNAVRLQSRVQNRHPAPLPDAVKQYQPPNWKALPPAPDLKLSKVENGIVISWKIEGYQEDSYEEIASYQLYAYQETSSPPNTALWKKIGDVKALPLPMACTLTHVMAGFKYYFAVRAVDIRSRLGPFSLPGSILLLNKL